MLAVYRKTSRHNLSHKALEVLRHILLHNRHSGSRRNNHVALIGPNGSREHPHQGCFPGAVAAQQSDALPGLDVAMDTVQEGRTAVPQMHITKSNKWHRDQNNRLWKQTLENLKAV